jgi:hypothetical protein
MVSAEENVSVAEVCRVFQVGVGDQVRALQPPLDLKVSM